MKYQEEINTVLQSKKPDSDMINVMEALGYGQDQFQRAFDIALEMDNNDFVKLLYSNYNQSKVIVELTLIGRKVSDAR
jgi:hypothetical protein